MKLSRRGLFGVTLGAMAAPLVAKLSLDSAPPVAALPVARGVALGDWCKLNGRFMVVTKIEEAGRGSVCTLEADYRNEDGSLTRLTTLVNSRDLSPFSLPGARG